MKRKIFKNITKFSALASLITPVAMLGGCSGNKEVETHILSINDFHGAAPGFGDKDFSNTNQLNAGAIRLAQETQEIISKYPGSTLLSCGDYNAGESFSTCAKAETLYPVLKAMNIQYSAVGNHAWEWGNENLVNRHWDKVARTDATIGNYFVTSNVLNDNSYRTKEWNVDETSAGFENDYTIWNSQRIRWADPYKILNMNGHNVCLIGLTTHDTMTDGNINAIKDLTFMNDYNASVVYAKHLAKEELKDDFNKIESFILFTHCAAQPLDTDLSVIDPTGECALLAKNATTDFDAILAAHSHRLCAGKIKNDRTGKEIWIGQAGQAGRNYLDTKIIFDDTKEVGKRLSSISMEVKTPKIDGQDLNPVIKDRKPDINKAEAQIKNIVETTQFDVVKNTHKVYEEQKVIALQTLKQPIGKIKYQGLPYYYSDSGGSFGTVFMQSPTLIEPASVFAQRGQVYEFNKEYQSLIQEGSIFPASVAFNNLDSFKNGFKLGEGVTEREVLKEEVFAQNAFENNIHYGCLTKDQLIQYINYFLEGATKFNYEPKIKYPETLYNDKEHTKVLQFDETTEKDLLDTKESTTKVAGTSYSCGPVQFYGVSFTVSVKATRGEFKVYQLDETQPIKVFLSGKNDFEDPSSWTNVDSLSDITGGYIPILCSSFTWQGGNAQNRMLHHWFDYNAENAPEEWKTKVAHRSFSLLVRDAILKYAQDLTLTDQALDKGIDETLIKKIILGL